MGEDAAEVVQHAGVRPMRATGLAVTVSAAVNDAGLRARAAGLGERIRAEDDIGRAVALIERQATRAPIR
jgi:hypothetical protein